MKHIKTFESYNSETISHNPIIRHIAGQGIEYSQQSDRIDTSNSCEKCPHYLSRGSNYCARCSKCLLSKEETVAKMTLAKGNGTEMHRLGGCMKKHGLKW